MIALGVRLLWIVVANGKVFEQFTADRTVVDTRLFGYLRQAHAPGHDRRLSGIVGSGLVAGTLCSASLW